MIPKLSFRFSPLFFTKNLCGYKIIITLCLPLKSETRSSLLFDETPERAHVASTCGTMKAFLPLTSLLLITHQKFIIYSLHQQTNLYSFVSFDTVLRQTKQNNHPQQTLRSVPNGSQPNCDTARQSGGNYDRSSSSETKCFWFFNVFLLFVLNIFVCL